MIFYHTFSEKMVLGSFPETNWSLHLVWYDIFHPPLSWYK